MHTSPVQSSPSRKLPDHAERRQKSKREKLAFKQHNGINQETHIERDPTTLLTEVIFILRTKLYSLLATSQFKIPKVKICIA